MNSDNNSDNKHFFSSYDNSPLSNFYKADIRIWNSVFHSSEQVYQYFKCIFHGCWRKANEIRKTRSVKACYRIGKSCRTSKLWQQEKVAVMLHILKHKYYQCREFKAELEKFDGFVLIENTNNEFWGRGKYGKGLNTLGALLIRVKLECELGE